MCQARQGIRTVVHYQIFLAICLLQCALSTKRTTAFQLLTPVTLLNNERCAKIDRNARMSLRNDEEPSSLPKPATPSMQRRPFLNLANAALLNIPIMTSTAQKSFAATANTAVVAGIATTPPTTPDLTWPLGKIAFSLLPLAGSYTRRATVMDTVIPETMWTMDQIQGIVNVNVPVRETIVKLSDKAGGGLLVYNPVAPTPQHLKLLKNLTDTHGPVRHILLGTVALEHKATFGPFSQNFPNATVWIQESQWAFPINLPIDIIGVRQRGKKLRMIPNSVTGTVSDSYYRYFANEPIEWLSDFDYETLGPFRFRSVGAYSESALFHKSSKTLLVTDCVVKVSPDPPPIIEEDPRAMLFHARDSIDDIVLDTEANRRKGWRRMVQFGLIFFPSQIKVVGFGEALSSARKIDKRMKPLGEGAVPFSLYPWMWNGDDDLRNFNAIVDSGLFCPPILTKLILDREPVGTLDFVNRVSRFPFDRIVPCHLDNNIKAGPKEFRRAFDVLAVENKQGNNKANLLQRGPLAEDLALLQKASDILTGLKVVAPSGICDGEPARKVGRFL
mmetsp:Transcript_34849/g.35015  ORF Transcript_34849/g.35015 Transcript_34849/m.35015 type:complete len:559 (-) Transcript_34849:195-1871(-)